MNNWWDVKDKYFSCSLAPYLLRELTERYYRQTPFISESMLEISDMLFRPSERHPWEDGYKTGFAMAMLALENQASK